MTYERAIKLLDGPWVQHKKNYPGYELKDGAPKYVQRMFAEVVKMIDNEEIIIDGVNGNVLDDGPWEAWLEGLLEEGLLQARSENPNKHIPAIDEWEKEHGRKIGTASPEEIAYRESAWETKTVFAAESEA